MDIMNSIVFVMASVTLFMFGLQGFSKEVQTLSEGPLKAFLAVITRFRFSAAFFGALATALIQSSSAVSAIAVALAHSGLMGLKGVLALLIGTNVGTASTAFLVSYKVQHIGPYFIVIGMVLSMLPVGIRVVGKTLFYFGLIFFALDQIRFALIPFYDADEIKTVLTYADIPLLGVLAGALLTLALQSSSVLTGVAVICVQERLLSLHAGVAIVLGSNIGTTATAIFASFAMGKLAKVAAVTNFYFNLLGVMMIFPFVMWLTDASMSFAEGRVGIALAYAHLFFNVFLALFFLSSLSAVLWLIKKRYPDLEREPA
jgi:phosphate:Na+ symporter